MAVLVTSLNVGSAGALKYAASVSDGILTGMTLPSGVYAVDVRPTFLQYKSTAYILGHYSSNILVNRYLQVHRMGIDAPQNAPILAASGTGITADAAYGYFTFVHKVGDQVQHESSPSPPSNTIVLANQGRAWTNLPTSAANPRVTHIRGYVSINGTTARLAWERELGTVSVTESVATLALKQVVRFDRGVPPKAIFGEIYHDRGWYVDESDRTKVHYSELFEPESVGALSSFTTWDGESITGIKKHGDVLLIFTRNSTYAITGWTSNDLVMRKLSPSVGCISHWSIVDINGRTWFASQEGVYFYDGNFRNMMKDIGTYFRDAYLADTANYENSAGVDDRYYNVYKLLIPQASAFYYVGHYKGVEPQLEGRLDQPKWVFDRRGRKDMAVGLLRSPDSRRDEQYTGSCDGIIRKENVESDSDDDDDSYQKALRIRFKHYVMDDPGGSERDGKAFGPPFWTYVEAELSAWLLSIFGGDEWAGESTVANWTDTVAASAITALTNPSAPTVTPQGVTGATAYSYKIVAKIADGSYTAASAAGSTATGNAVLSGSNFNRVSYSAVSGAVSYDIYRTVGGATQGLIGTDTASPFDDTGFAGDGSTAPTVNVTGKAIKTTHYHALERVSGRGFTVIITATAPLSLKVRGFGGIFNPGISTRGFL